jgi:Zn-dependent peptidase ImmA (M78 family)
MKKLNRISICNHWWSIRYEEDIKNDNGNDCYGLCVPETRLILIDAELKGEKLKKTFLHELFHALVYEYSINQADLSADVEEIINDVYANFLGDNFYVTPKKKLLEVQDEN